MRQFAPIFVAIPAIAALSLGLAGCGKMTINHDDEGTSITASGETVTRNYALSGFTGVVAAGPESIIVRRGDAFSVHATGDKALLDQLTIRVVDGKLEIRRRNGISWTGGTATIAVTMPTLTSLAIAGSGDVDADTLTGDAAEVSVAGSGDITLAGVDAKKLEISIAGSGSVTAAGRVDEIETSIAGSGDVEAPGLTAAKAEINIIGSGGVTMAVTGTADVTTAGSGDVTLTGGATCTSSKLGSGDVTCS